MDDRKKQLIEALSECYGIVTDACRKVGVPRSTYYNWLKEDAEFKAACDDQQEEALDFVEGQLFKKISGVTIAGAEEVFSVPPSDTAIIFYLKTKGKRRGYVERQEMDLNHSGGVQLVFEKAVKPPDFETK